MHPRAAYWLLFVLSLIAGAVMVWREGRPRRPFPWGVAPILRTLRALLIGVCIYVISGSVYAIFELFFLKGI